MGVSETVYRIISRWDGDFAQKRTHLNAIRLAFCLLLNPSRNTITQSQVYGGLDSKDWSYGNKVFSRSKWDDAGLFKQVIEETW